MPPALWGALTALGWGTGDFLSRFTGGRLGIATAMAGVMSSSFLLLSAYAWSQGMPLRFPGEGWPALLVSCICIVGATGLLYLGMIRGPISLVAPIVAAYPVWSLLIALAYGVGPTLIQLLAMAAVMAAVVVVARLGSAAEPQAEAQRGGAPFTILVALLSSIGFASGIAALQTAGPLFGEMQVLLSIRLFGVIATLAVLLALPSLRRPIPWRWWPVLLFQGTIDGGAYLALLAGSRMPEHATAAVVVASTFCVVPVLLAWVFLRERIHWGQWLAIGVIVAGVAVLSAY